MFSFPVKPSGGQDCQIAFNHVVPEVGALTTSFVKPIEREREKQKNEWFMFSPANEPTSRTVSSTPTLSSFPCPACGLRAVSGNGEDMFLIWAHI